MKTLIIGDYNMTNPLYADDISDSCEENQTILDIIVTEREKRGFSMYCNQTECIVDRIKPNIVDCIFIIRKIGVKQVVKFCYIGSLFMSEGIYGSEIKK